MRKKGHYIIPLFFLLLTLAPLLFMGSLQVFQFYIKERMEASLERDALQIIVLPEAEVKWYEEDREILVNGKLFDVKIYTISNGIFTAQGVFDEQETEVMALLNGTWGEKEQTQAVIQLLLLSQCFLLFSFYVASFGISSLLPHRFSFLSLLYYSPLLSILVPPPKALRFHCN